MRWQEPQLNAKGCGADGGGDQPDVPGKEGRAQGDFFLQENHGSAGDETTGSRDQKESELNPSDLPLAFRSQRARIDEDNGRR